MPAEADQAFVTLATTDGYGMGAVVVGKSLRRHGTAGRLVVMVTPNISPGARLSLESVFDEVVQVDVLDSADRAHLAWLGRPELGVTLTKLHCWSLTHYHKCVFLDADTLVLTNVDELFEREELSAAPDPGWPDCFNSGVFVFRPSLDTHRRLLEHAARHGSFDGGDQGLLNSFFSDWSMTNISKHLPFLYNVSASALYTHLPAFHQYGRHAKIVHFLGGAKPWHFRYSPSTNESHAGDPIRNLDQYVSRWWEEYLRDVEPHVTKADAHQSSGPAPAPAEPRREKRRTKEPIPRVGTVGDRTTVSLRQLTLSPPTTLHPDDTKLRREKTEQQAIIFAEHPQPQDMTGSEAGHSEWEELYDPPSGQGGGASGEEAAGGSTSPPGDTSSEPAPTESEEEKAERRRKWEEGDVDYMGKDAFDNIKKKLDRFLD